MAEWLGEQQRAGVGRGEEESTWRAHGERRTGTRPRQRDGRAGRRWRASRGMGRRRRDCEASARGEVGEGKKGMQVKETVGVLPCATAPNTSRRSEAQPR